MAHYDIDARSLLCPMPMIKAQQLANKLHHGDTITVFATDRGAQHDLPCWCRINGHSLLMCKAVDGVLQITLRLVKD